MSLRQTNLLSRAREGDPEAEDQLFQGLSVRFRLFAARRIDDTEAAHDVAQEAMITVLRKYRTETFQVSFEAWAWGVLQNHIRNHLHRLTTHRRRLIDDPVKAEGTEAPRALDPGLEQSLLNCLRSITRTNRRYARALNLIHQGYSTNEICDRLDMNPNSLYVTLFRAREMLRRCLETGRVEP